MLWNWTGGTRDQQGGSDVDLKSHNQHRKASSWLPGIVWVLYRKFLPGYATLAALLTDLTQKSAPTWVVWTPQCGQAIRELKKRLCSTLVLWTPEFTRGFVLQTDVSDRDIGAVLCQLDDEG